MQRARPTGPIPRDADGDSRSEQALEPRFDFDLTFFARLTVSLRAEPVGDTPAGFRINFFVVEGRVQGPKIDARIRPGGRDRMCISPDGVGTADIDITYEVDDGSLIFSQSRGICQLGVDCLTRIKRGEFTGTAPFYPTPTWSTAASKWAMLNGTQGFGVGIATLDSLEVAYDMYIPRIKARRGS